MSFSEQYKDLLIQGARKELHQATKLEVGSIASMLREIGFSCTQCGGCCRGDHSDNRVMLLQQDILHISKCGLSSVEFSLPFIPAEVEGALKGISDLSFLAPFTDSEGNIHSFGWMLRRKKNSDCHYLEAAGLSARCTIYNFRPTLCQTYPFYMEDCELHTSECKGLGSDISYNDSLALARLILDRYIHELEECILVYQLYEHFEPLGTNVGFSLERFKKGHVVYIVHDSEGAHRRCERM